jgi:hypothetical protein
MLDEVQILNKRLIVTGRLLRIARIDQEWYFDVEEPESIIEVLRQNSVKVDIFTFWQRLPDSTPRYKYYMEWDDLAVLPIKNYDYWWSKQIKSRTRGLIRKAEKEGVIVREGEFNDSFVRGMVSIFNESAIRQGKPFWHYGKDFDTVKREFSKYLFREDLIGAYYKDELIGFIMLAYAGPYAMTSQIISKIAHRDKAPNNALLAKAVEICERKKIPYLVYLNWGIGSLTEFKRRNGFQKVSLPRYYIPLTITGKIALRLDLHRGFMGIIPERLKGRLIKLRSLWYKRRQNLKYQNDIASGVRS